MRITQLICFFAVFTSNKVCTRNETLNIFFLSDSSFTSDFDGVLKYIGENFDSSVEIKKIFGGSLDTVTFLRRLCEEYLVSYRSLKIPHLIFDATQSTYMKTAVKFFTKSLALPTVSLYVSLNEEKDAWSKLEEHEKKYLIQIPSPLVTVISLLRHMIMRQNMTNVVIIHDHSVVKQDVSRILQNLGIRKEITMVDSEANLNQTISTYTRHFSNFLVIGKLITIKRTLEMAEKLSLLQNEYCWYAVTLQREMVDCLTCKNATIVFMQPSVNKFPSYVGSIHAAILIETLQILGNCAFVSKWFDEDFINCDSFNGTNTPFRTDMDLRDSFEENIGMGTQWFYSGYTDMDIHHVVFLHGEMQKSVIIGTWISSDDQLKLNNEELLREFVDAEVLKVVVVEQRPFMFVDEAHPRGFNGYLIDLMEHICVLLETDFSIQLASDNKIGDLDDDGNWNGLMKDILESKADIGLATVPVSSVRDNVIDFTIPFYRPVGSVMLMKLFRTETSLNKFIDVMETEVWLCILAAFCTTSLLIWIFEKYNPENPMNRRKLSFKESLWFCFLSMTPQGADQLPSSTSGRLIAVVWWLFSFIILASYTANLSAILTVSLLENPLESMEDLDKEYKLEYGPVNGSSTMRYFLRMVHIENVFQDIWKNIVFDENATTLELSKYFVWTFPISGRYTTIWSSMLAAGLPQTMDEALARIRKSTSPTDGFVFLGDATDCKYLELTNCDLQTIGEEFSSTPYAIVVPQGSDLKKRLDFAILEMMNNRLLERLETKWWKENPYKKECEETENQFDGIGLRNIGGVFIVILFGIISATIVLILEFYWIKFNRGIP